MDALYALLIPVYVCEVGVKLVLLVRWYMLAAASALLASVIHALYVHVCVASVCPVDLLSCDICMCIVFSVV